MHIVHDDGTRGEAAPGDAYVIDPDHAAWAVEDEPVVAFEFESSTEQTWRLVLTAPQDTRGHRGTKRMRTRPRLGTCADRDALISFGWAVAPSI